MGRLISYSEAFKMQVVNEWDSGKYDTISGAARAYEIRGGDTVRKWIIKYGKNQQLRKVVRVETVKEIDERQQLRKEVKKLKSAVADLHLDKKLETAFLEIACQRLGISVEEFKKKNVVKQ